MIGDVLLIDEKHTRVAARMTAILSDYLPRRIVVAIAGESGTGKSEIAHELRKLLKEEGYKSKILHGDNYYRIPPAERTMWRKKHGIECVGDEEYDWDVLNKNVDDFRERRKSSLPFLDLYTNQKDLLITHFDPIDILLLEGLYCLRSRADVKFFIDLTYKDTEKAQRLRGKEPQTAFRKKVLERESYVVQSHRHLANYYITPEFEVMPARKAES